METSAVRVLVVGDSGVGKTTLLQGICRDPSASHEGVSAKPHRWTIGCDVHVLLYQYREGSYGAMKDMYIEFVDVGGHTKYEISRAMFYHDVQGILLVHDLSNAKSYDRLRKWLAEISDTQREKGCVLPLPYSHHNHHSTNDFPSLSSMPKLVVGNKRDLVSVHTKRPGGAPELRGIDTLEASAEPFSLDANVLYGFLDRVVAFAKSQGYSNGVASAYNSNSLHDTSSNNATDFTSVHIGAFSDGLRQTNPRPLSPSSTATPSATNGSWWR